METYAVTKVLIQNNHPQNYPGQENWDGLGWAKMI